MEAKSKDNYLFGVGYFCLSSSEAGSRFFLTVMPEFQVTDFCYCWSTGVSLGFLFSGPNSR